MLKKIPLRKVSSKQAVKLRLWKRVTMKRIAEIADEFGVPICLWCGTQGYILSDGIFGLHGHHMDGNRENNTPENCYPCHNICHLFISDNNVDVRIYPNSKAHFEGKE